MDPRSVKLSTVNRRQLPRFAEGPLVVTVVSVPIAPAVRSCAQRLAPSPASASAFASYARVWGEWAQACNTAQVQPNLRPRCAELRTRALRSIPWCLSTCSCALYRISIDRPPVLVQPGSVCETARSSRALGLTQVLMLSAMPTASVLKCSVLKAREK